MPKCPWVYIYFSYKGAWSAVFTSSVSFRNSLAPHKTLYSIVIHPNNNHTVCDSLCAVVLGCFWSFAFFCNIVPCLSALAYCIFMWLLCHASTIITQQLLAVGVNVSDPPARAVSVNYFCFYQSAQRITKASSVFRTAAAHSEHECSRMLLDGRMKRKEKGIHLCSCYFTKKPFLDSHSLRLPCSHTVSSCKTQWGYVNSEY